MGSVGAIRVLVTDDEPSVRGSLEWFLSDYGFDVSVAESAESALKLLSAKQYDVAIVDLRLPGMSGDALILEAHRIAPDVRFLLYTGSMDYRLSEDLKRIGVTPEQVYTKPVPDLADIARAVERLAREGSSDDG